MRNSTSDKTDKSTKKNTQTKDGCDIDANINKSQVDTSSVGSGDLVAEHDSDADNAHEPSHALSVGPISAEKLSRRDNRSLLFHLLYAAEAFDYGVSLESIVDNFARGFDVIIDPKGELFEMATSAIENRAALDEEIKPLLANWRLDRLGCATRLILRMALWELKYTSTPSAVILNEAVELAKCFAERDAYKFVNGVLDCWVLKNQKEEEIPTESRLEAELESAEASEETSDLE